VTTLLRGDARHIRKASFPLRRPKGEALAGKRLGQFRTVAIKGIGLSSKLQDSI